MEDENKEETKQEPETEPKVNWPEAIKKGDEVATRIEAGNVEHRKILAEEQELAARNMIGGHTEAGQTVPQQSEEEKKKAGAMEFFKGTQLEKDIEKANG